MERFQPISHYQLGHFISDYWGLLILALHFILLLYALKLFLPKADKPNNFRPVFIVIFGMTMSIAAGENLGIPTLFIILVSGAFVFLYNNISRNQIIKLFLVLASAVLMKFPYADWILWMLLLEGILFVIGFFKLKYYREKSFRWMMIVAVPMFALPLVLSFIFFIPRVAVILNVNSILTKLTNQNLNRSKIDIPIYEVSLDPEDLDALNSDLPYSGRKKKKAILSFENQEFKAKLKYKGNMPNHYAGRKKSFRLYFKNRKSSPIPGNDALNFSVPRNYNMSSNTVAYWIADQIGADVIDGHFGFLYVNEKPWGVTEVQERLDGFYDKRRGRTDKEIVMFRGEMIDPDPTKIPLGWLWQDEAYWENKSNIEDGNAESHLKEAVTILNDLGISIPEKHKRIQKYLNVSAFLRVYAALSLVNSTHVDQTHNQAMRFGEDNLLSAILVDPYPFYGDIRDKKFYQVIDAMCYLLLKNPEWRYERDRNIYNFLKSYHLTNSFDAILDSIFYKIYDEIKMDAMRCFFMTDNKAEVLHFSHWHAWYSHNNQKKYFRSRFDELLKEFEIRNFQANMENETLSITYHSAVPLLLQYESADSTMIYYWSDKEFVVIPSGELIYPEVKNQNDFSKVLMYKSNSGFETLPSNYRLQISENILSIKLLNPYSMEVLFEKSFQ